MKPTSEEKSKIQLLKNEEVTQVKNENLHLDNTRLSINSLNSSYENEDESRSNQYSRCMTSYGKRFYKNLATEECSWNIPELNRKNFDQESQIRISTIGDQFIFVDKKYEFFEQFCGQFGPLTDETRSEIVRSRFFKAFGDDSYLLLSRFENENEKAIEEEKINVFFELLKEILDNLDSNLEFDEFDSRVKVKPLQIDIRNSRTIFQSILMNELIVKKNKKIEIENIANFEIFPTSIKKLDFFLRSLVRNLIVYYDNHFYIVPFEFLIMKIFDLSETQLEEIKNSVKAKIEGKKDYNKIIEECEIDENLCAFMMYWYHVTKEKMK